MRIQESERKFRCVAWPGSCAAEQCDMLSNRHHSVAGPTLVVEMHPRWTKEERAAVPLAEREFSFHEGTEAFY